MECRSIDLSNLCPFRHPPITEKVPPTNLRVERRAHDVVVVAGEDGYARAALPVPDADRLLEHEKKKGKD